MKQLILVRHANSPIHFVKFKDFDRPLDSLGESDAKLMAKNIIDKGIMIDNIISIVFIYIEILLVIMHFHWVY